MNCTDVGNKNLYADIVPIYNFMFYRYINP